MARSEYSGEMHSDCCSHPTRFHQFDPRDLESFLSNRIGNQYHDSLPSLSFLQTVIRGLYVTDWPEIVQLVLREELREATFLKVSSQR